MKPIKKEVQEQEYDWRFNRVNSKGEILFSHITNETVNTVRNFLESKNIKHSLTAGAGSTMFRIEFNGQFYSYYTTTGRWAPYARRGFPSKHYTSKGIEDFYNRFLLTEPKFKIEDETKASVKNFLEEKGIEFKIKKDVVTLTTKIIPRKDGRGNKRRYTYEYIIGKGKWRGMRIDESYPDSYYQAGHIESFIEKFFIPQEEL